MMLSAGMEEPPEFDIVVKKGSEFSLDFALEDDNGPINVSGWSHKAQLLTQPGGVVLMTFSVVPVVAASGAMRLYAAASTTAALSGSGYEDAVPPAKFFAGYYDYFAGASAATATSDKCWLQGVAKVYPRGTVR